VRRGGIVVALLGLATLASCSSGGGLVSGGATPGHGSPKDAAAGFLSGLAAGGTGLCPYVDPSDQSDCNSELSQVHTSLTGSYTIANDVIQGDEALVAVTGHVCINFSAGTTATSTCGQNSDPNQGFPTSSGGFQEAYEAAVQGSGNNNSTIPCIEVGGSWYVSESFSDDSGTTPTTATPGTSPVTSVPGSDETTLPTTPESTLPTTPGTTTPLSTPTTFNLGG
jgi:hypothetical protein